MDTWDISPALSYFTDHILLFGEEELLLGIDKNSSKIVNLKTSNSVYECKKIETYCYTSDRIFLSVTPDTPTPLYGHHVTTTPTFFIQTLVYDPLSGTLTKLAQFPTPHLIVSLRHMPDKLVGTSAGNVYIWTLQGDLCGELALPGLPGSEGLVCRVARFYNSHTFLAISCGNVLYSLVLNPSMDDQRLVSEVETQGNVFVCGFYSVFSEGGSLCMYNMVTESLSARLETPEMKVLDVCTDYPIFLFHTEDAVLLCHFNIPDTQRV